MKYNASRARCVANALALDGALKHLSHTFRVELSVYRDGETSTVTWPNTPDQLRQICAALAEQYGVMITVDSPIGAAPMVQYQDMPRQLWGRRPGNPDANGLREAKTYPPDLFPELAGVEPDFLDQAPARGLQRFPTWAGLARRVIGKWWECSLARRAETKERRFPHAAHR